MSYRTVAVERPEGTAPNGPQFGSDVIALTLRDMGLPYVALNPGASFRGLHHSLVNYLGNTDPQMLLCLHEEHAVAIAHGYAKVTGRSMAAAVHSNVGLMHATMAIFNAWCDRMPVVVLGATGPVAADKRRPWVDWIHTAADQVLVRNYVKWDDQPATPAAARGFQARRRKGLSTSISTRRCRKARLLLPCPRSMPGVISTRWEPACRRDAGGNCKHRPGGEESSDPRRSRLAQ